MLRNLLVSLASLVVTLLLLEAGYRGYQLAAHDRPFFESGKGEATGIAVIGHPLFHYVPNPALPEITDEFFRTTGPRREDEIRVAALGGSTTFDTEVPAESSYAFLLRERLEQEGIEARVLNGGAPGYRLAHLISRYVHQVRHLLRPDDWLIIDIGYNDTLRYVGLSPSDRGHADLMKVMDEESSFWRNFRVLNWARARLDTITCLHTGEGWFDGHLNSRAYRGECGPVHDLDRTASAEAAALYRQDLELLLRMAQADGVRPVLLLQDYDPTTMDPGWASVQERIRTDIAATARRAGATVLDTRDFTKSRSEYFADPLHMNRKGNQVRAAMLARLVAGGREAPEASAAER